MNVVLFRALAVLSLLRPKLKASEKATLRWALEDDSRISFAINELKKKDRRESTMTLASFNPANILEALKAFLELLPQILAILNLLKKQQAK